MKAHPSQAEGDAIAYMVLDVLRSIRTALRDDRSAPVDVKPGHTHSCRWCSTRWSEHLSTGFPQAVHSGYPQVQRATISEPGTVAPVPALTIAPLEEPMMTEDTAGPVSAVKAS